jgi:hypothetical protein
LAVECDPVQLVAGNTSNTITTTCDDGSKGVVNNNNNLLVCYNGSTPGSIADVTCDKGYNLADGSAIRTSTCLVNGLWNYYSAPTCRKEKGTTFISHELFYQYVCIPNGIHMYLIALGQVYCMSFLNYTQKYSKYSNMVYAS